MYTNVHLRTYVYTYTRALASPGNSGNTLEWPPGRGMLDRGFALRIREKRSPRGRMHMQGMKARERDRKWSHFLSVAGPYSLARGERARSLLGKCERNATSTATMLRWVWIYIATVSYVAWVCFKVRLLLKITKKLYIFVEYFFLNKYFDSVFIQHFQFV